MTDATKRSQKRDKALEEKGLKRHKVIIPDTDSAIEKLKNYADKLVKEKQDDK